MRRLTGRTRPACSTAKGCFKKVNANLAAPVNTAAAMGGAAFGF